MTAHGIDLDQNSEPDKSKITNQVKDPFHQYCPYQLVCLNVLVPRQERTFQHLAQAVHCGISEIADHGHGENIF